MARGACTFRISDLTRALRGAKAAGIDVRRIRIAPDGAIEIDTAKATETVETTPATEEIVL